LPEWLPLAVFGAHVAEEYVSGFPEWATRHFGTTSRRFFIASHVVLISRRDHDGGSSASV